MAVDDDRRHTNAIHADLARQDIEPMSCGLKVRPRPSGKYPVPAQFFHTAWRNIGHSSV